MRKKLLSSIILTFLWATFSYTGTVEATMINDIDKELNDVGTYYYQNHLAGSTRDSMYTLDKSPQSLSTNYIFDVDTDSTDFILNNEYSELLYMGENIFNNYTPIQQTYNTAPYSLSVTNSTTTTTQNGFNVKGNNMIFPLPFKIKDDTITGEFNASSGQSKTESKTETITAFQQPITVPPYSSYKVVISLEQLHYNGIVNYKAKGTNMRTNISTKGRYIDRKGTPYVRSYNMSDDTGYAWSYLTNTQRQLFINKGLDIDSRTNTLTVDASSKVEGAFGSKMVVSIYDISTNTLIDKYYI